MKKFNFLSNLWSLIVGSRKDDGSTRLRVDYDSFTCRLRVWTLKLVSVLVIVLSLGIGNAWGADVVYKTAKFGSAATTSTSISSYTTSGSSTYNGFQVDHTNGNNNANGWAYIKFGRNNTASTGTITTNATIDVKITKVSITIDAITAAKITSITLYKSANKSSWTSLGTFTKSTGTQTVTIAAANQATSQYYKIEIVCTSGTSNGLITISNVDFYATG